MEKGILTLIDNNGEVIQFYSETSADMVKHNHAGTETTVAALLDSILTGNIDALDEKQDKSDILTGLSNLTLSADKLILATGKNSFSTTALTSTGKSIISATDAKAIRKALGVYKHLIYDEMENVWGIAGGPQVSGGKLILDGTSYIGTKNQITLGASPFTAELFVNAPATSAYNTIFTLIKDDNDRFRFCTSGDNSGKIIFLFASSAAGLLKESIDSDPFINQKVHLAFSYDGSKIRAFFGGNLLRTWDVTLADVSYSLAIGGNSGANFLTGIVDEFRLSNTCRYKENFTPEERFEVDEHTLSLLHFD